MQKHLFIITSVLSIFFFPGCRKIIDVGDPVTSITGNNVFAHDSTAIAAVTGIYSLIIGSPFSNIMNGGLTICAGLSSDELTMNVPNSTMQEFATNTLQTTNSFVKTNLWYFSYRYIYQSNACIEGLVNNNKITGNLRDQLIGECYFIRAFTYFLMLQLYGDIPLILSTNYNTNVVMGRTSTDSIMKQVKQDLFRSTALLTDAYPSNGRVRVNLWAAKAMLARVYLYQGDWADAESASGQVINAGHYALEHDPDSVFLSGSKEAILQFMPSLPGYNTIEGNVFVPSTVTAVPQYSLSTYLMNAFEKGDKRAVKWVGKKTINSALYPYPYKYKYKIDFGSTFVLREYYMVLRLAEQYLIRAEARVHLGNLPGAINDIDAIRNRAGLPLIGNTNPGISADDLLAAIMKERQIELFAEWGNRWMDLKRTGMAGTILKDRKAGWNDYDTLYPIPSEEIILNPHLTQNPGYN